MKFGKLFENPALKTRITSSNVKLQEMAVGYFLAPMCAMLANSIFGAYLSRYYSDVLGWTKFGTFAALLPIVSVVLVVAGNLMVGRWIDNTSTPAGKARPYLLLAIPLMAIAIILMFLTPTGGSNIVQMVFIALTYNFYYAVAYPCYYTAHSSMVSLSTRNANQRGLLATLSNAGMVAAAGVGASIVVPILLQPMMFVTDAATGTIDIASSYNNWRVISIVLAIVTAAGILLEYLFTRERITEESAALNIKTETIPTSRHIEVCTKEPYWWMVIIFILVFQAGQLVKNTSMSYYVRWMFDSVIKASNPESASGALMSTLGLIGGLPSAVGMVIAWPLASKLGKKRAIVLGLAFSLVGGLVSFINVHSFGIVCVGVVLKAIGIIPAQYVMLAVLSDVLDHLEAKHGFRSDGFSMSIYGAIMVGLLGLAIGIVNGVLSASGYDATLVQQSASTERMIIFVYLLMDIITFGISIAVMWKMDVEKYAKEDHDAIIAHQKAAVLAEGGEWIEPEVRAKMEQEKADREAEEARIADLKAMCQKKGLSFEEEEKKYQEKQAKRKNSIIGKLLG